jgi:hypothetical protein
LITDIKKAAKQNQMVISVLICRERAR